MPINLTKDEKERVRDWLTASTGYQITECPFRRNDTYAYHNVCDSWFPKSRPDENGFRLCPCHAYDKDTVLKSAREMLKAPTKRAKKVGKG